MLPPLAAFSSVIFVLYVLFKKSFPTQSQRHSPKSSSEPFKTVFHLSVPTLFLTLGKGLPGL